MKELPELGLYISTKKVEGMKFVVEDASGENPDEFYLVEVIDQTNQNNSSAMGEEMDNEQWESMCEEYGLVFEPGQAI